MIGSVPFKPATYHTVSPYLVVNDPAALIDFVVKVFDAQVISKMLGPDGAIMHADVLIGDSHVMLGQAADDGPFPGMLHLYLLDCDSSYSRALDAGAASLREPQDEYYGDRLGGVSDPFGNQWWLATHIEHLSEEEIERRGRELSGV
jgi:uncharacterized glyoxalase superfamily protein PhnB